MPKAVVTLKLQDIGCANEPDIPFGLRLRDAHMPHTTIDAVIHSAEVHTAVTDVNGEATISVIPTPDFVLGSGIYVVMVGTFLSHETRIDATGDLRSILGA